jgi:hypothetical protein
MGGVGGETGEGKEGKQVNTEASRQLRVLINHPTLTADQRVSMMWFNVLGFCGCGQPEEVLGRMRSILEGLAVDTGGLGAIVGPDGFYSDSDTLLWCYLLDGLGLSEHGTGIGWGRITDEGRAVLSWLRKVEAPSDCYHESLADEILERKPE